MMNINKVLEILNSGEYVKIEESHYSTDLRSYKETNYTMTLAEGGKIRIKQVSSLGFFYRIQLFVPNEKESVESWTFSQQRKGWLKPKTIKDPLYDEVELIFYKLHHRVSMEKLEERSKYFPQ